MSKEKKDNSNIVDIILGLLLFFFVLWLWKYSWEYIDVNIVSEDNQMSSTEARGLFGDKFGAVNALFSALAFAGIIFSFFLQRRDLKYQRDEIIETRKEFTIQNNTLKIQRFENTFFNILNLHHQIIAEIDFRYYKKKEKERPGYSVMRPVGVRARTQPEEKEIVEITGRDVFRYRYNKLFEAIQANPTEYEEIYLKHYGDAKTDFGHYFRNLYRMIKSVDETDFYLTNENSKTQVDVFKIKYGYVSIIRAQLSDYELAWLFYNCLSENGIEKFKPLIEKYSIFDNLPHDLIPIKSHMNLYDQKAFNP